MVVLFSKCFTYKPDFLFKFKAYTTMDWRNNSLTVA